MLFRSVATNTVRIYALKHDIYFENSTTAAELQIRDFIESLGLSTKIHDREQLRPLEIDVYVPNKMFGIEYNGLHWHAVDESKHLKKQEAAEKAGIDLVQLFDYEWDECTKVKSMLASRLGKSDSVLFARNCKIQQLSTKQCAQFMNENHLHSSAPCSIAYGLIYNGEVVSGASFSKPRFNKKYDSELVRFCNKLNHNIIGGFSRLLAAYKKDHCGSIITYCHRRLFKGSMYEKVGFDHIGTTSPGYFWIDSGGRRLQRYSTQKHKLSDLLGDQYDPDKSESFNMERAGYRKVWDCGQKVYILK